MVDEARNTTMVEQPEDQRIRPELLARIRAEYREMPGLDLTVAQAARLWGLSPGVCAEVLQALVAEGTVVCTRAVRYVAAATERAPRRRAPGACAQRRGAA